MCFMNKLKRIGKTSIATNGQKMTITDYNGNANLTIEFEDGVVVYNKTYQQFVSGNIKNPNFEKRKYIGLEFTMSNGQLATIIEWNGNRNVDIQFEDGTIVKNKTYQSIRQGKVKNPNNCLKHKRIGEKHLSNSGQLMEITDYITSSDVTVRFEDGTVANQLKYGDIKRGEVTNPIRQSTIDKYIVLKNKANNHQVMEIIAVHGYNDIEVEFEDGTVVTGQTVASFRNGTVLNPNLKSSNQISINEYILHYYLNKYGFIHANKGTLKDLGLKNFEIDLYHSDLMIGIEYDGYGHEIKKDLEKNKLCKRAGIILYRFREPTLDLIKDSISIDYLLNSSATFNKDYEEKIKLLINDLNKKYHMNINEDINLERDKLTIRDSFFENYSPRYDRTGETTIASNGQEVKILNYRGYDDIDVQFEDGTIVNNQSYAAFRYGYIQNPLLHRQNTYVGRKVLNNNGQIMEIIKYDTNLKVLVRFEDGFETECALSQFERGSLTNPHYEMNKYIGVESVSSRNQKMKIIAFRAQNDIDVEFEDGTIVKNKRFDHFLSGNLENPNNTLKHERIGERNKANNGEWMTITNYNGVADVEITFDDGTVVYHKSYQAFLEGYISKKNKVDQRQVAAKAKRIGEKSIANNGLSMEIIDYRGARDIDIQFEDGVLVTNKRYDHFQSGNIKHPNLGNIQIKDRTSEVIINENVEKVRIMAYRNNKDIDVMVNDERIECHRSYDDFVKGKII